MYSFVPYHHRSKTLEIIMAHIRATGHCLLNADTICWSLKKLILSKCASKTATIRFLWPFDFAYYLREDVIAIEHLVSWEISWICVQQCTHYHATTKSWSCCAHDWVLSSGSPSINASRDIYFPLKEKKVPIKMDGASKKRSGKWVNIEDQKNNTVVWIWLSA